jgi:diaminopimelate epimerase
VYQYTLSTPFNLATASYDNVLLSVNAQDGTPLDIAFNSDGSKMYMVGAGAERVYQYTLSTPFDLSTASYDSVSFSVAAQDADPRSIIFNNDGTKMYMFGDNNRTIYQYTTNYDFISRFLYQIIHTGTTATFNTLESDYTIEVAT